MVTNLQALQWESICLFWQ